MDLPAGERPSSQDCLLATRPLFRTELLKLERPILKLLDQKH